MFKNNINSKKNNLRKKIILGVIIGVIFSGIAGYFYWKTVKSRIYIEEAVISAPEIKLASPIGGTLEKIYVKEGDKVTANTRVAQVGYDVITTKTSGIIIKRENKIGEVFAPHQTVVSMINPFDLRVVASIQEDKGLKDIQVGDQAYFTVDAFGSQKFPAVVEEISPTSKISDVVFNISDKRAESYFNIKLHFDTKKYPQFKNGMSARVWIYKK